MPLYRTQPESANASRPARVRSPPLERINGDGPDKPFGCRRDLHPVPKEAIMSSRAGIQVILATAAVVILFPGIALAQCGPATFTSCPGTIVEQGCVQGGEVGAFVNYPVPIAENECGPVEVFQVSGPPPGNLFSLGPTEVEWATVPDEEGRVSSCTFTVYVEWNPIPICPHDLVVQGCKGDFAIGADVDYEVPVLQDGCGEVEMHLAEGYPPGSFFPVGSTDVRYEFQTPGAPPYFCQFEVVVQYEPTITGCRDTTVYVCPGEHAAVQYTPPTAYDDCGPLEPFLLDGPPPNGSYDVGSTRVEWGVDNGYGGFTTCFFYVNVVERDDTPPEIECPADIFVVAGPGEDGVFVDYVVSANDDCGLKSLQCTPPSGEFFGCGSTTVTCTATDFSNNSTTCSFEVIVATPVAVDVKPRSCPNAFKITEQGQIPVAVVGTEDFDVTQLDPASIRLEGVPAMRWSLADVTGPYTPLLGKTDCLDCNSVNKDKIQDLTLKFSAAAVMAALGPVEVGECRVVHLSGSTTSGCPVAGEDVIRIVSSTGTLGLAADLTPGTFALRPNLPNPFSAQTLIRFAMPEPGDARLTVYDVQGRMIKVLETGELSAGTHDVRWDGTNQSGSRVPGGIYLYRLTVTGASGESYSEQRKMVLKP